MWGYHVKNKQRQRAHTEQWLKYVNLFILLIYFILHACDDQSNNSFCSIRPASVAFSLFFTFFISIPLRMPLIRVSGAQLMNRIKWHIQASF